MKYKAKSHNLKAHFNTEYAQKVGLCNLQLDGQVGLIPVRQVLLQRHDHAGGYDGDQHRSLKRWPLDYELCQPAYDVGLTQ